MKIYHIVTHIMEDYYPFLNENVNNYTKLDHSVNKFIKNLIKNGNNQYEHILINLSNKYSNIQLTHEDGYKVIIIKGYKFLLYPFQFSFELIKIIKKIDNGIFHIHGLSTFIFDFISPFLFFKQSIIHHRGGHFTWKSFPISFIKYILLLPIFLRFYNKIIVENKQRKKIYNKLYLINNSKIEYIPGFINVNFFKKYNYDYNFKNEINLLFVGRLEKTKGVMDLINVFNKISINNKNNIHLNIVGNGSLKEDILKKTSNNKKIKLLGFKNYNELNNIYLKSDIFILPTYSESFGLVLIEAMSLGLPVISTFTDGPISIIDNGVDGLLFKSGDIKKLELLINNLLIDGKKRQNIGKNAKNKVKKYFLGRIIANSILKLYNSI